MPYGAKNGTVNGTDFVSFGRGEDALLLIPGLGDGLRTVKGMALSLSWLYREYAKAYRVYVFSRRNALPEGFTIRDMADDLKGAMDALGLRRADVLGVSQGGMIAQYLAAAYPEAVGRLALAVTAAWANPTVQAAAGRWAAWAESGDYGRIVTDTAERMYSEKTPAEVPAPLPHPGPDGEAQEPGPLPHPGPGLPGPRRPGGAGPDPMPHPGSRRGAGQGGGGRVGGAGGPDSRRGAVRLPGAGPRGLRGGQGFQQAGAGFPHPRQIRRTCHESSGNPGEERPGGD